MFTLPSLPFEAQALDPHMSRETLMFHHGAHHRDYVDKLNSLIEGTRLAEMPLEGVIRVTRGDPDPERRKIFRNAAQHWNHSFFWNCLTPRTEAPGARLSQLIARDFGSLGALREQFHQRGMDHFGSGWLWLVLDGGTLALVDGHDADTPAATGAEPLLCCDLWEHAYYLDYQNRRAEFLDAFFDHLANWPFAEQRLADLAVRGDDGMMAHGESATAPDPRVQYQSPEMLMAQDGIGDAEKAALFEQWHLDLDNRLKAEEEGMSASDPMNHRQESRLADEAARVQTFLAELSQRPGQAGKTRP